jgi:hypothetical protein
MWLPSGWWLSLRNQVRQAPDVATEILDSVDDELADTTALLSAARGRRTEELSADLFGTVFRAEARTTGADRCFLRESGSAVGARR